MSEGRSTIHPHNPYCECSTYLDEPSVIRQWWQRFRWTLLGVVLGVITVRLAVEVLS